MIVRLLSYNIRFGGRRRESELAEVIRAAAPDIVVFREAIDPGCHQAFGNGNWPTLLGRAPRTFHRLHQPLRDEPS